MISWTCTNWHMIDHMAFGICTAYSRAWISAMLSNAGHSTGTIRIINALRPATIAVCIANVWWNTSAFGNTIFRSTLWIFTAWWGEAWIVANISWNLCASGECIASKSRQAIAVCWMSNHMTFRIYSACIRTRILASFSYASFVIWTVIIQYTLRSTVWRTSNVIFHARTNGMTLSNLANWEWAAWWWWAWIFW